MTSASHAREVVTILSGGVGGAKMARGFVQGFPDLDVRIITNTADDEVFYGLYVAPDLDTMMYTLSGLSDPDRGWGIRDDTFQALDQLARYGRPAWFQLGDRDLATHIVRTDLLRQGMTLTQVTSQLCKHLGVTARILPMADQKVSTVVVTSEGPLPFQEYFVRRRKEVIIRGVLLKGIETARCTESVAEAIAHANVIVLAPSNPVVSIRPILSVGGVREALDASTAPKVAVSPFVGRRAISGPARELMEASGFEGSSMGLASFYGGLLNRLFVHWEDAPLQDRIEALGTAVTVTETVMPDLEASIRLAREVLAAERGQRKVVP